MCSSLFVDQCRAFDIRMAGGLLQLSSLSSFLGRWHFEGAAIVQCLSNSSPSRGPDHVTIWAPTWPPPPHQPPFPCDLNLSFVNLIRDGGPVGACAQDPSPKNNELVTNLSPRVALQKILHSSEWMKSLETHYNYFEGDFKGFYFLFEHSNENPFFPRIYFECRNLAVGPCPLSWSECICMWASLAPWLELHVSPEIRRVRTAWPEGCDNVCGDCLSPAGFDLFPILLGTLLLCFCCVFGACGLNLFWLLAI